MTTHPEAAMTREQVLDALSKYDKAVDWRKYNQGSMDRLNDVLDAAKTLADAVRALTSTKQGLAPAADAEEVARKAAEQIVDEYGDMPLHFRVDKIELIIRAALRRYAAIFQISPLRGTSFGWWADIEKDIYDRAQAEHYKRRIVYVPAEAAARASGEKGGQDV